MSRLTRIAVFTALAVTVFGCSSTYKASATTGLKTRTVYDDDTSKFGYATGSGVIVADVDEKSEAYTKGLRDNDLIKSVNGKAVTSARDFEAAVMGAADGSAITLKTANAKKQEKDVTVKKDAPKSGTAGKMTFGISAPFLLYREPNGTAIGHFNILRFRNKKDEHGFMLLEMLGWVNKPDGWGVRLIIFHFGSASIKPAPGSPPDI